jgi:MoxR-like ATPase
MAVRTAPARAAKPKASLRSGTRAKGLEDLTVLDVDGSYSDSDTLADDVEDALSGLLGVGAKRSRSTVLSEARDKVALALSLLDDEMSITPEPDVSDSPKTTRTSKASASAAKESVKAAIKVKAESIMRPNGQPYHPRVLAGQTDVEAIRALRAQGINVLLYGAPGCGKTALLEAAFGDELVTFPGHGDAAVEELVGSWRPLPKGGYEWVDGPLVMAMEQGRPLFVDDTTLTPSTVLARLYPAMDGRNEIVVREHDPRRIVKAKEGFCVVGAHNPGVPGAVLSEALASRFNLTIEVGTDYVLAKEVGVDTRVVRAAAHMDKLRRSEQVTWAPQMRELMAYKRVAEILGEAAAIGNLLACAPEGDERDILCSRLTWVEDPKPLSLGERA